MLNACNGVIEHDGSNKLEEVASWVAEDDVEPVDVDVAVARVVDRAASPVSAVHAAGPRGAEPVPNLPPRAPTRAELKRREVLEYLREVDRSTTRRGAGFEIGSRIQC